MKFDIGKLITELPILFVWIGIWGIVDTIIQKYVKDNNYNLKIIIYIIILLIAAVIHIGSKNQAELVFKYSEVKEIKK